MHRFIRTLLFGFFLVCFSAIAFAQVGVSITIAPAASPGVDGVLTWSATSVLCPADRCTEDGLTVPNEA